MKNKFLTAFIAIVLLVGISTGFMACSKNVYTNTETKPLGNVQQVAESILEDSLFTNLVRDFMNESTLVKANNNDTSLIKGSNERIAASLINFVINQKEYNKLSSVDRNKVLKFIADSLKSENYILSKPGILNNLNSLRTIANVNNINSNSTGNIKATKLSIGEVVDCIISTAINALGFYGDALGEISSLLKTAVSPSVLIQVGMDIFRNASPWWKVGAIVLQFSNCLYQEI